MPKVKQTYLYFYAVVCLMVNIMACISAAPAAVISTVTTHQADTCPLMMLCVTLSRVIAPCHQAEVEGSWDDVTLRDEEN